MSRVMDTSLDAVRRVRIGRAAAALGLVLLVTALALYTARVGSVRAAVWLAAGGALLLAAAAAANARALAAFLGRRDARRGADALLSILFMAAILVVIQATSVRRSHTFDLTRNHRHTLAPQTTALLDSLDRDVEVTGFFRQTSTQRAGAEQLLELYARQSPRFRYSLVDPDRQPERTRRAGASLDDLLVQSGEARRVARSLDEEGLTNALLGVMRSGPRPVYFTTGHGEKDIHQPDRDGYTAAVRGLDAQGYVVRTASLLAGAPVPDDCAVLVVAGPRHDFLADEAAAVGRFLAGGGSVLFLLDPRVHVPHLASLLVPYGLRLLDAVVLDDVVADAGDRAFDATVVKVQRYEAHAITRDFNYITMFPRARPIMIDEDSTLAGLDVRYLCFTGERAWGEIDMENFARGRALREGVDLAGPLPVAAAAKRTPLVAVNGRAAPGTPSRVVLCGDSDFANNAMYGVLGNADFFLNTVAFLADDENLISIRPRRLLGESVYITERQGRMVFLVCMVLLPLTPIAAGVVVMARRRRL